MFSKFMQAALLYGKEDIRVETMDIPRIGPEEILVRVMAAFVCGTDVRIFRSGQVQVEDRNPLILGHEISGVIERVGGNVQGYAQGQRVAIAPNMGCGVCEQCIRGNTHLCEHYEALGINLPGGFAEYVRVPAQAVRQGNVWVLPDRVSFVQAALAEPLSCVLNGFERANIRPGDTVLVIGAGPIGIMHAKLAKMAGARCVMIHDLSASRLEQCRRIDSSFVTLENKNKDLVQEVLEQTHKRGVDVCIVACPAPSAQVVSLKLTAVNGRVIFFGGLPRNQACVSLDTNLVHYKQLLVTGTTRSSLSQFRRTLQLIADGLVVVDDLVTAQFYLKDIGHALKAAGQGEGLKNLIVCHRNVRHEEISRSTRMFRIPMVTSKP